MEHFKYISKKTNSVFDPLFTKAQTHVPWKEWFENSDRPLDCREEYLKTIHEWIGKTQRNCVFGLDRFTERHLINGTTQTFDETYMKYAGKRLRFFPGEYAYHRRVFSNYAFIDDDNPTLEDGDWVIVSAPHCTLGDTHPKMWEMMDRALEKNVPVIVDCAYFGTCSGVIIDVTHPAIESVSFSLTKGLGMGDIRSGIRYSNIRDTNPICQQNEYNHTILSAAKIGLWMMSHFGPDFIPNKYIDMQKSLCSEVGIQPTKCMHLALGDASRWPDHIIDGKYYRLGIRELIKARRKGEI